MDQVSQSSKVAIYGAAVRKERRKYARRWCVIGLILGEVVGRWREYSGWPWWQATLIVIFVISVAWWVIDRDTK